MIAASPHFESSVSESASVPAGAGRLRVEAPGPPSPHGQPASPVGSRFFIHTFGCQMNVHDSDRMEEVLVTHGWSRVDSAACADLIVFNTCSVREKAEQKLRSEVGRLLPLKQARPDLIIAVAGCVAQQEGEKLLARMRHVDLIVGPDNIAELPALLAEQSAGAPPTARTVFDEDAPRFLAAAPHLGRRGQGGQAPVSTFVTTMKGCDERCSFCIVPYTRGPERYRPAREILDEVKRWVDTGAQEVVLLGQTVDSYRDPTLPPPASDDPDESQFPWLLRAIAREVPKLARLRYTSPHPRHATPSLAAAHREIDVLARHVHLPVQSGSDRMLKRMIRRYTRAEYVERAQRLLAARKGLTLSTDIIVGFSGETDEDFEATLSLVNEVGFTSLFGFKYSPRPYTPALKLKDDVPEEVKAERLQRLFDTVDVIAQKHLASLVGTTQKVLIEGPSKSGGATGALVQGRTEQNEIVHVMVHAADPTARHEEHARSVAGSPPTAGELVGQLLETRIVRANKHSLAGELTAAALGVWRRSRPAVAPGEPARRALPLIG